MSANSVHLSNRRDSERTLEHSTRAGQLCPGLGCREPTNHAHDDFTSRAIAILMAKARHSSSARACCFTACCSLALAAFQASSWPSGKAFQKSRLPTSSVPGTKFGTSPDFHFHFCLSRSLSRSLGSDNIRPPVTT